MIATAVVFIWFIGTLLFVMLHLVPSEAVRAQFLEAGLNERAIAAARAELGVDQPLHVQYVRYWVGLARGDLGRSLYTRQPIAQMLLQRLPRTLTIASLSWVLGLGASVLWVMFSRQRGIIGTLTRLYLDVVLAVPVYWSGTLVLFYLAVPLGIKQDNIALIVGVLALHTSAAVAKVLDGVLLQTAHAPFVLFARSKGLSEQALLTRHRLRLIVIGVLPFAATQWGFLLGGTVLTETLFLQHGIGSLLVQAVLNQDYPVVQAIVLLLACSYGLSLLLADALTDWLDPRSRIAL